MQHSPIHRCLPASILDEAARRVLLVATFFPASASAEALGTSADVQCFAFDRVAERLADLSLLDTQAGRFEQPAALSPTLSGAGKYPHEAGQAVGG